MEIIDIENSWSGVQECVRKTSDITESSYNTWIRNLEPCAFENDVLTVCIPNDGQLMVSYYEKKYKEPLEAALKEYFKASFSVRFISRKEGKDADRGDSSQTEESCPQVRISGNNALPNQYRFENFVVGDSNRFAYLACLQAATNLKDRTSGPLYLYGGTGLGKTHLLMAFRWHVINIDPQIQAEYLSGEKFADVITRAIRDANLSRVYDEYGKKDVLMIDGVEALSGDIDVQRAFNYVYDDFCAKKRLIIMTSHVPPEDMMFMKEWTRSRLAGGLIIAIGAPDKELRREILRTKDKELGLNIPQDVLEDIAETITSDVRRLEGALITSAEYLKLTDPPYDTAKMVRKLLMEDISIDAEG